MLKQLSEMRFCPKWIYRTFALATLGLCTTSQAEDRDGLRFNVSKKTVGRADQRGLYTHEIDRDLVLKAMLKNLSMKDLEAGQVEFTILIRRWGSETGSIEKYTGKVELPVLKKAGETEIKTSEFHIGGHMHGTSNRHVDQLEGWKFSIIIGAKTTEFRTSNFEALNKRAMSGS